MNNPWSQLSAGEIYRIGILSADLDMLSGDEVYRAVPPEQRTCASLAPLLDAAAERQDWEAVLALLRNGPDFLSTGQIAYQRGEMYANPGHPDIAALFFEFAARPNAVRLKELACAV